MGMTKMARKLLPAPRPLLLILAAALWLAACAQVQPQDADRRGDPDCAAAAAEFGAARGYFADPARHALTAGGYAESLAGIGDESARDGRLLADLQRQNQALDRLSASYGALRRCHADNIAAWNAARAAGSMTEADAARHLSAQQQASTRQWAEAQAAFGQASSLDDIYMAASAGRIGAAGLGPIAAAPFVARGETPIQDKPDAAGTPLATLRKGQRVLSSDPAAQGGWTAIDLDDGTTGYVSTAMLRPVTPNPSERQASVGALLNGSGVKADLARESRLALPQKQAALSMLVAELPLPAPTQAAAPRSLAAQASTGTASTIP